MAIVTAICNSFKQELLKAAHNFSAAGGHVFKAALYDVSATLGEDTTGYTATGEASGTGYASGGAALTNQEPGLTSGTAFTSFNNVTWASSSITARGCLIYNSSASNKAVSVHLFDSEKTSSDGDFTIIFPAADASNAILRLV